DGQEALEAVGGVEAHVQIREAQRAAPQLDEPGPAGLGVGRPRRAALPPRARIRTDFERDPIRQPDGREPMRPGPDYHDTHPAGALRDAIPEEPAEVPAPT